MTTLLVSNAALLAHRSYPKLGFFAEFLDIINFAGRQFCEERREEARSASVCVVMSLNGYRTLSATKTH